MKSNLSFLIAYVKSGHVLVLFAVFMLVSLFSFAQHHEENKSEHHKNIFLLSFGYTHIPKGAELHSEESEGFFVPTVGLDYGRVVGKRWEIGVMLDWELDHYIISEKELEREKAFIAVAGVAYNPIAHLAIFTGAGIELEHNQHLFVFRLGTEYAIHLGHHWALAPAFYFDWKEDYDTYALSLGLRYSF